MTVELKVTLLEQGFLLYDGKGSGPEPDPPLPLDQLQGPTQPRERMIPRLVEKARDRWYVPDPNKQAEREFVREKDASAESSRSTRRAPSANSKSSAPRLYAPGFKACWQERDYGTIVKVAAKLPEAVLQEDEKLLMYYDNARTRLGDE
jgi:hypothetical protein